MCDRWDRFMRMWEKRKPKIRDHGDCLEIECREFEGQTVCDEIIQAIKEQLICRPYKGDWYKCVLTRHVIIYSEERKVVMICL